MLIKGVSFYINALFHVVWLFLLIVLLLLLVQAVFVVYMPNESYLLLYSLFRIIVCVVLVRILLHVYMCVDVDSSILRMVLYFRFGVLFFIGLLL